MWFSDGSSVSGGPLNNAGGPLVLSFPPRKTNSLLFTVDSVSSSTGNVGLSEIKVLAIPDIVPSSSASALPPAQTSVSMTANIAGRASVKASSQSGVQPAYAAIDGVIAGYPGNVSPSLLANLGGP